jgi:hypothetical protein
VSSSVDIECIGSEWSSAQVHTNTDLCLSLSTLVHLHYQDIALRRNLTRKSSLRLVHSKRAAAAGDALDAQHGRSEEAKESVKKMRRESGFDKLATSGLAQAQDDLAEEEEELVEEVRRKEETKKQAEQARVRAADEDAARELEERASRAEHVLASTVLETCIVDELTAEVVQDTYAAAAAAAAARRTTGALPMQVGEGRTGVTAVIVSKQRGNEPAYMDASVQTQTPPVQIDCEAAGWSLEVSEVPELVQKHSSLQDQHSSRKNGVSPVLEPPRKFVDHTQAPTASFFEVEIAAKEPVVWGPPKGWTPGEWVPSVSIDPGPYKNTDLYLSLSTLVHPTTSAYTCRHGCSERCATRGGLREVEDASEAAACAGVEVLLC